MAIRDGEYLVTTARDLGAALKHFDPAQEMPVLERRPAQPGHQREHLLRGDPVRLEVIFYLLGR